MCIATAIYVHTYIHAHTHRYNYIKAIAVAIHGSKCKLDAICTNKPASYKTLLWLLQQCNLIN